MNVFDVETEVLDTEISPLYTIADITFVLVSQVKPLR